MATTYELLTTALANVNAQIAQITARPKPTYSADGQSVSWGEHFRNLNDMAKLIREQMQAARPFVVVSRARS